MHFGARKCTFGYQNASNGGIPLFLQNGRASLKTGRATLKKDQESIGLRKGSGKCEMVDFREIPTFYLARLARRARFSACWHAWLGVLARSSARPPMRESVPRHAVLAHTSVAGRAKPLQQNVLARLNRLHTSPLFQSELQK